MRVNRAFGTTIHSQWVQHPHSVVIAGMFIHALPVSRVYTSGYFGWWTIADSFLETIKSHPITRAKEVPDPSQADTDSRPPGLSQASSQPPVKKAKIEKLEDSEDSETSTAESDYEDMPDLLEATQNLANLVITQPSEPSSSSAPTTSGLAWNCDDPMCGKHNWPDGVLNPYCKKCQDRYCAVTQDWSAKGGVHDNFTQRQAALSTPEVRRSDDPGPPTYPFVHPMPE